MEEEGNQPSQPVQRALAAGSNVASASPRPKPAKVPAARAGTAQQPFETQPAKRSAVKSTAASSSHATNPNTTPKKQTTLPFVSPNGKTNTPKQSPAPRPKTNAARARAATEVGPSQGQTRYVAQAPKPGGTQHAVAKDVVNLVSDEDTSSSAESDDDRPLAAQIPKAQKPAAPKEMFDLTAGDSSDDGQAGEGNADMNDRQADAAAAENPAQGTQQGGSDANMVVELVSSDDDACPQQQAAVGGSVPGENEQQTAGENNAPDDSAATPEKHSDRDAGPAKQPAQPACKGTAAALAMVHESELGGEVRDTEMVDREADGVPEQNAPARGSDGAGTSKGTLAPAEAEAADPVLTAQHQSEDALAQLWDELVDEEMHDRDALPDTADVPVEEPARLPATEHVEDDVTHEHKSAVLADIAQALSGGGTSQANAPGQKEHQRVQSTKASVPPKAAPVKQEKQTKTKKQKHPHIASKHDKKGPMLFHHISRQPLSIGLAATEDLHRRIDREDQDVWQYWVTSLRQRMRQHTMSQQEAHYIFKFEHYRFCLPHSTNALWPSVVEGFIRAYGDWIQEDPVVREVCHAHLLRLTRLRLLAPMQTSHCLKMLNGKVTPCPDYMFDHLRPAEPAPPVEDAQDEEELAEEERRKEAVAVARLAALQKAAAGTKKVVGLKRPVPGVQASQVAPKPEPGCDGEHPGELERLLGADLPTDHVSLAVKKELMKLDSTLANQAGMDGAGPSTSAPKKQKLKLKIRRKACSPLPVMFRYVSPSQYPEAEQRQIEKGRVRKLSDICPCP